MSQQYHHNDDSSQSQSSSSSSSNQDYQLWPYDPSVAGNIVFASLFALLTVFHIVRSIMLKRRFYIPLIVGAALEAVGLGCRAAGHYLPKSIPVYAVQSLLILVAPSFLAATIYMSLSRLMRFCRADDLSPVRATLLTKLFVLFDVLAFLVQSTGGGSMAQQDPDKQKAGQYIALGGLILQIVFVCMFIATLAVFHARFRKDPRRAYVAALGQRHSSPQRWLHYTAALYAASALVLVRCVFRTIEFALGQGNYLLSHEWTLFVGDSTLMVLVVAILAVWHFGQLVRPTTNAEDLTAESKRLAPEADGSEEHLYENVERC